LDKKELKVAQKMSQESLQDFLAVTPKNNDKIYHQVGAFIYLTIDKINENNNHVKSAYKHYKDSGYYPYKKDANGKMQKKDADITNALLSEQDIEGIYYNYIRAQKIDINSETNQVAQEFRTYLYDGLEYLLLHDRLRDADIRTDNIMLYIAKQEREGYLTDESLQNFSCSALKAIDEKWYNYPEKPRHFGFRVQKQIWQEVGSPNPDSDDEQWITFWRRVGWMDEEKNWITYSRLGGFVSVDTSNLGNLPSRGEGLGWMFVD
jgi:hypothetical protein